MAQLLIRRWVIIVGTALLVFGGVAAWTAGQAKTYSSTTTVYYSVTSSEGAAGLAQTQTFLEDSLKSYAEVAKSRMVLDKVIQDEHLPIDASTLATRLAVTAPPSTSVLSVTAYDADPERAARIANSVLTHLNDTLGNLWPGSAGGTRTIRATVLQQASVPDRPASPNVRTNALLGLALGLLVGAGFGAVVDLWARRKQLRRRQSVEVPVAAAP